MIVPSFTVSHRRSDTYLQVGKHSRSDQMFSLRRFISWVMAKGDVFVGDLGQRRRVPAEH
jgi:hypothetical protein